MRDVRADLHIEHPQPRDVLQERAAVRDAQADEEVPFVAEGMAEERDLAEAREERERALAGAALVLVEGLADHEERAERGGGEREVLDGGARAEDVHLARGRRHPDALRPERAHVLAEVRRERAPRGGRARGARRGEDDDVRERRFAVDERPEEVGERELARPAAHKRDGGGGCAREGSGVFEDLHEYFGREKGFQRYSREGRGKVGVAGCHQQLAGYEVFAGLGRCMASVPDIDGQCGVVCERK